MSKTIFPFNSAPPKATRANLSPLTLYTYSIQATQTLDNQHLNFLYWYTLKYTPLYIHSLIHSLRDSGHSTNKVLLL